MRSRFETLLLAVPIALFLGGCDRHTPLDAVESPATETLDAAGHRRSFRGFVPLALGDRWTYQGKRTFRFFRPGGETPVPEITRALLEHTLTGTEKIGDRTYMVDTQRILEEGLPDPIFYWYRHRQDRSGLYEARVAVTQPPPGEVTTPSRRVGAQERSVVPTAVAQAPPDAPIRAAWETLSARLAILDRAPIALSATSRGGPEAWELTRLDYPLQPGTSWTVFSQPYFFVARVLDEEILDLPAGRFPAYRIQYRSELWEPTAQFHVWYGRCGFLKSAVRFEAVVVDENGLIVGTLVVEEERLLNELSLRGHHPCEDGDSGSGHESHGRRGRR